MKARQALAASHTARTLLFAALMAALPPAQAAQEANVALRTSPNALLTIDQNRGTVIERIVGDWGEALAKANAGITAEQLRATLSAMRADYLLAASMAGSLEGLRQVVESSLEGAPVAASASGIHAKSLGDPADDLVYTPLVPCRIVDTRNAGAGGTFGSPETRNYHAYTTSNFTEQGGAASNCGMPADPAAVTLNLTVVSATGNFYLTAWPYGQPRPLASTLNYTPGAIVANGAIIPICVPGCAFDFSVFAAGVNVVVDVVGYFNRPSNYVGTHTITGLGATDSGGYQNRASGDYSAVGGGYSNAVTATYTTVGGGHFNSATQNGATVGGGDSNWASHLQSTIGGGLNNAASGYASTVGGGTYNTASGDFSTVAGGSGNVASGMGSFAVGIRAKTQTPGATPFIHDGTFVFADANGFDFHTQAMGEFAVRATGGARFVTAIDSSGNPTRTLKINPNGEIDFGVQIRQMLNLYGSNYGIGVQDFTEYFRTDSGFAWFSHGTHSNAQNDPGTGGAVLMTLQTGASATAVTGTARAQSFVSTSDRNAKTGFAPLDGKEVLAKVVAMPVTTWTYRNEPGSRHMGPVAQDFHAAFGLGSDDRTMSAMDASGVALAAIQGLKRELDEKNLQIERLERALRAIENKLGLRTSAGVP